MSLPVSRRLDFTEIPAQSTCRLIGGVGHDGNQRGAAGQGSFIFGRQSRARST